VIVTDLQAYLLSSPLPEVLEVKTAAGLLCVYKQDCLLLRICTDGGLKGYASGPASANLAQLINRNLKAAVINIDPVKIDGLRKKVLERRPLLPGLKQALGLIELALLDLRGKIEGCPVSELLGGRVRQRIPLIARAGFYLAENAAAEESLLLAERGFRAYRLRAGLGPAADAATIRCVREALPEECRIVVDAQAWWQMGVRAYPPEQFDNWVRQIATYSRLRLAEPFHPENRDAYRELAAKRLIPLAVGEHEVEPERLRALAKDEGVDVLQASVTLLGGLITVREILSELARGDQFVVLTGAVTPLEVVAMAHLGICFPSNICEAVEWPCRVVKHRTVANSFSLGDDLMKTPLLIDSGELMVPDAPGLGFEVNESVIELYPWKSGPSSVLRQCENKNAASSASQVS
jgi:D-galactarolactone cycloisomerase